MYRTAVASMRRCSVSLVILPTGARIFRGAISSRPTSRWVIAYDYGSGAFYETSKPRISVEREQAPVAMGGQDGGVDQARRDSLGRWIRRRTRPPLCRDDRERHAHQDQPETMDRVLLCRLRCGRYRACRGQLVCALPRRANECFVPELPLFFVGQTRR